MKKSIFAIFSLLVLLLSVMAASAAVLRLGDSNTLASLRQEDENIFRTTTWIIPAANTSGTMTCTVSPISGKFINTNENIDGNINVTFTNSQIASGQGFAVTAGTTGLSIRARIPETLDAVDPVTLVEGSFKVADIVCTMPGGYSTDAELYMQRKNMYDFKKISATYGDKSDSVKDLSGEEIKDVRPGETLDMEVEAENLFDSDFSNADISATIYLDSDSSFFDCDDDSDDLDLDAGDKDTVTFSCDVDEEAEKTTTDLDMRIVAIDDFGAAHGADVQFSAKIERDKYDFKILSFTLSPQSTVCGDDSSRTITAVVKARNDGDKNEKDGKIEVVSPQLGVTQSVDNLELDSTDDITKRFTFSVPSTVKAGTYDVFAKTYNLGTSQSDQILVRFTVADCNEKSPVVTPTPVTPTPVTPAPVVVQPAPPKQDVVIVSPPVAQNTTAADDTESTGSSNGMYLVLLVILIVVLIAGIIGLVIYLLRPAN